MIRTANIVYGLFDPAEGIIMYVGKTHEPKRRLRRHVNAASGEKTEVQRWVKMVVEAGRYPSMILLEVCKSYDDGKLSEKCWIEGVRQSNPSLTNSLTEREKRGERTVQAQTAIVADLKGELLPWPPLRHTEWMRARMQAHN